MRGAVRDGLAIVAGAVGAGLVLKLFVIDACRIGSASMEPALLQGDFVVVDKILFPSPALRWLAFHNPTVAPAGFAGAPGLHRGDVVVFRYPGRLTDSSSPGSALFVKRCIGLPGDTVLVSGGTVIVNSRVLSVPSFHGLSGEFGPFVVPARGMTVDLNAPSLEYWQPLLEGESRVAPARQNDPKSVNAVRSAKYAVTHDYIFVLGDNLDDSFDSRSWGPVREDRIIGKAVMVYWSQNPSERKKGFWQRLMDARWSRIGSLVQ